jgi:hypothetical protein
MIARRQAPRLVYTWPLSRSADDPPMSTPLHEKDVHRWLAYTAELVREGRFDEIDRDILIDETFLPES